MTIDLMTISDAQLVQWHLVNDNWSSHENWYHENWSNDHRSNDILLSYNWANNYKMTIGKMAIGKRATEQAWTTISDNWTPSSIPLDIRQKALNHRLVKKY